ncbi:hypothetical protein JCM33374_g617 [Metschnikowia sp. JCM 33374]|nr:hypothetical protein JCM33374_g617 [Metschnikowia sp. JCM 33374]
MAQSSSSVQGSQHRQGPHQLQSTPGIHGHNGQPGQPGPHMSEMPQNVLVPSMNYVPMDQNTMLVHPGMPGYGGVGMSMPQQEMPMGYGQQIQQMQPMLQGSGEMYKPPMTQLPQLQPHMDQGYQQYIGYPPVNRNGLHYSNSRM